VLAVLGATGYTGRLVCAQARELGIPLRLVGRRRDALEEMSIGDVSVADARDEEALTRAFEGATVIASCAGPFVRLGPAPVAAAIRVGAHYLDTSGEYAFARSVYDRFGSEAGRAGVVLLTSFGFDYAPGDFAARLAADGLEPLDELAVAYSVANMHSTRGTRRSVIDIVREGHFGATTRRVRFPFGERDVVEWGGTEPLSVPRHTEVREVRSYVRASRVAARLAPVLRQLAPLAAPFVTLGGDPLEKQRRQARFTVVAESLGPAGGRRVALSGSDPYGLTALLIARAAQALLAGEARGTGALAPAEAFDARDFLARLAPLLLIQSEESVTLGTRASQSPS
jgi:short subunit dehydrogenase-like uncharacterized protein